MQNVNAKITGSKLTIEIDLDAPTERSASGKTNVVASTRGNAALDYKGRKVNLGLNAYFKD